MNNKDFDILIDEALKTAPATHLSENFAQKVVLAYQERVSLRTYLQPFFWTMLVTIGVFLVTIGAIFLIEKSVWQNMIIYLQDHLFMIISLAIISLFIFFLNQVCLPYAMKKFIDYP